MVNYELIEKSVKNGERIPVEAITFTYYDPKDYMGSGRSFKEFNDMQKDMHIIYLETKINELELEVAELKKVLSEKE